MVHRNRRRKAAHTAAMLALVATLAALPVHAQNLRELGVSDDEIRNQRRVTGNSITFCVNSGSLLAPFERELAAEIASALLLEYEIFEVVTEPPTAPYDFRLMLDDVSIFRLLARSCDAIMGYTLLTNYPDWIRPGPVYLTTEAVLVARSGEFGTFGELPPTSTIGTRTMSLSDNYLTAYLRTLPESRRPGRNTYLTNLQIMERLADRSVDAALVWAPALYAYEAAHDAAGAFEILPGVPFGAEPTQFVLAVRPQEQFIELSLSQAVQALTASGTIERLAIEHGLVPAP
ncbi:MAG: substrate-binding periplasmic protein [Bauldia sp.]